MESLKEGLLQERDVMKTTLWSSKCSEPILVEVLHPQLPPRPHGEFIVVTLNMAEESDPQRVLREFERRKFFADADVVLLQEVMHSHEGPGVLEALVEAEGFHALFGTSTKPRADGRLEGMAILTRRPLRDPSAFDLTRFGLHLRSRCRVALAATVQTPFGPVRVFGVHLDTRINSPERIAQLKPVLDAADRFGGPVILAGDFNTQPVYWVHHILPVPYAHDQRREICQFLGGHGFSTPVDTAVPTFERLAFQLDGIYLRSFRSSAWGVEPIGFSDHRAVWVSLTASSVAENGAPIGASGVKRERN